MIPLNIQRFWQNKRSFVAGIMLCCVLGFVPVAYNQTDNVSPPKDEFPERSAAIDAWRVEMAYVKTNRPVRVNGFLVGSGGGAMGTIVLKKALSVIDTDAFTCTFAKPIAAGEEWSAFVTEGKSWSMSNVQMNQLAYPILAMVTTSNGKVFTISPAVLKAKIDINAGDIRHSNEYAVETKRPIKAGDTTPVLVVSGNIFSVEALEESNESGESKPWFTAFLDANTSGAPQ